MIDPFGADDHDGDAVQKSIELVIFTRELGDQDMQDKEGKHRDDAVGEGNGCVRHRDAGELRDDQSDHELEGLELRKLSFPHQTHDEEEKYIGNDGS